jgi:hypothetical protein
VELSTFVTKSLVDIWSGVQAANGQVPVANEGRPRFYMAMTGPAGEIGIGFDVAVTVTSSESAGGGGGVQIAVFRASIGGEERQTQENVSRIQFRVYNRP